MCILRGKEYDYGSIGMFFDSIFEYSNACVATASTRETNPMSHHVNLHFVRTSYIEYTHLASSGVGEIMMTHYSLIIYILCDNCIFL